MLTGYRTSIISELLLCIILPQQWKRQVQLDTLQQPSRWIPLSKAVNLLVISQVYIRICNRNIYRFC